MSGRIFVTGGAGFIGSHTCKLLAARGVEPVVYDNLVTGHRDAVRWGPFIEGDILDSDRLGQALRDWRRRTSSVRLASRSSMTSPTQTMGMSPASIKLYFPEMPGGYNLANYKGSTPPLGLAQLDIIISDLPDCQG